MKIVFLHHKINLQFWNMSTHVLHTHATYMHTHTHEWNFINWELHFADEMYQFLSYLPEDVQYTCRVCSPEDRAEWKSVLRRELLSGLRSVLISLTSFKCAHHLLSIDNKVRILPVLFLKWLSIVIFQHI